MNGWPLFVSQTAWHIAAPTAELQKAVAFCDTGAPEEWAGCGTAYSGSLSILTAARARLGGLPAAVAARRVLGEADGWSMEVVVAWRASDPAVSAAACTQLVHATNAAVCMRALLGLSAR